MKSLTLPDDDVQYIQDLLKARIKVAEKNNFKNEVKYIQDIIFRAFPRPPIRKGMVVRYKDGWMRVTAAFKTKVNLGPVWGGRGRFSGIIKDIPLKDVYEDGEAQYESWSQSETYMSM